MRSHYGERGGVGLEQNGGLTVEQLKTSWFAATKMHSPARRNDALLRQRLVDMLKESLANARLTLLSAPAGAGKTTLLAELPHAIPEIRWAWLLLDEEDNDPSRFVAALVTSLEQIDPSLGLGAWGNPQPSAFIGRQAVTAIINNVLRSPVGAINLVIDDFHVICEESVLQTLEYLIDRLPPNLRVIIGSRHDPPIALSRWRARGELAEVRVNELNFTEQETGELVNACLKLSLDPAEVRMLYARTEGWAAGLRLLATSMAQAPANGRPLMEHGMQGTRRVFEFLAEEVLDRQEPELRRFLLETSILSSLSPPICDDLTGRTDSQNVLDELYRLNLYVVAADEAGTHYRYHDLFADFLRDRLRRERPEDLPRLHERAAHVEADPNRRVRHWMLAGKWDEAAVEIESVGPDHMRRGFTATLRRWILELPLDVRRSHPRVALLLGSSIWARSEFNEAWLYFEEAVEGFRQRGDPTGQGEALVALSMTAAMLSQADRAEALFREALTFPLPPASRVELHAAAGWDATNRRDWPALQRNLNELLELIAEPAVASNPFALVLLIHGTSFPEYIDRLDRALNRFHEQLESASGFSRAYYCTLRASSQLFRGEIARARQESANGLALAGSSEQSLVVTLSAVVVQALAAYADGDWERVETISAELLGDHNNALFIRHWRPMIAYFLGRARCLAGNISGARESYQQIASIQPDEWPQAHIYRLFLLGLVHIGEKSYGQAQEVFEKALAVEQEQQITAGASSAVVLLAYTHLKRGHTEEALQLFSPYVELRERLNGPGDLLRENHIVIPLLRLVHQKGRQRVFIERILEQLGAPINAAEEISGEALSERELEVLRVLADGLSNREIGERLFVSEATVKTHVQRILRKLDASSRTHAVARARESMLL